MVSRMPVSNFYYIDGCVVYNVAASYAAFKIHAEAFNQCHSGSEATPFSPTLRTALPLLSESALLLQRIWSVIAAAAGTVRSACQTEIHVSGMSPRGVEQFSQICS